MVGNLSKHKKNIDNIYTKAEVDRHIKSAAEEKGDELAKKIDKAASDINSGLEQKADKTSVDADISEVNVALERIKYYGSADVVPSDESWFTVNDTGETITGLMDEGKTQTELVIPYKINNVLITALGSGIDGTSILHPAGNVQTKVVIPNSIKTIGKFAFYSCTTLVSVNIPHSVTSIEQWAFNGCSSLTSIDIPNSVATIGYNAFAGCTSLTSITIPNSVTSILANVFIACSSLTSVVIPDSVTGIGESAFLGCNSLTSITIPHSVTSIREDAFYTLEGKDDIIEAPISGLIIYCEQGSYADTYARHNGIPIIYTGMSNEPTFHSILVESDINFIGGNRVGNNGVYMVDYEVTAVDTSIPKVHCLTNKADSEEVLTKINTTEFTPTADYQPATKKYVDDNISAARTEFIDALSAKIIQYKGVVDISELPSEPQLMDAYIVRTFSGSKTPELWVSAECELGEENGEAIMGFPAVTASQNMLMMVEVKGMPTGFNNRIAVGCKIEFDMTSPVSETVTDSVCQVLSESITLDGFDVNGKGTIKRIMYPSIEISDGDLIIWTEIGWKKL